MKTVFCVRVSACLLCGLAALCAQPAAALPPNTGVYWSFVNRSVQPVSLRRLPDAGSGCWDVCGFPAIQSLPALASLTVYFELTCFEHDNLTVEIGPVGEVPSRVSLWMGGVRDQSLQPLPMTRNVLSAYSDNQLVEPGQANLGTSDGNLVIGIDFLGTGVADTLRLSTEIDPIEPGWPGGSYRATCNAVYIASSGDLNTDCLRPPAWGGGVVSDVTLHVRRLCAQGSTVSNLLGYPRCDRWNPRIPGGTYLASCLPTDFDPHSGALDAQCLDDAGDRAQPSRLETWRDCAVGSTVSNAHGRLQCDSPFVPGGSYRSQCGNITYLGGILQADCRSFVPFPGQRLDYAQRCVRWSSVRFDNIDHALECDMPRANPAAR